MRLIADELASAKDGDLKRKLLVETAESHSDPLLREAAGKVLERLK